MNHEVNSKRQTKRETDWSEETCSEPVVQQQSDATPDDDSGWKVTDDPAAVRGGKGPHELGLFTASLVHRPDSIIGPGDLSKSGLRDDNAHSFLLVFLVGNVNRER